VTFNIALQKLLQHLFSDNFKKSILASTYFFVGFGVGFKVPLLLFSLYLILFFGKSQLLRLVNDRQILHTLIVCLILLTCSIAILYSDGKPIHAWDKKLLIAVVSFSFTFLICAGEKNKVWKYLLFSFLFGMLSYLGSKVGYHFFIRNTPFPWTYIFNPFSWEQRASLLHKSIFLHSQIICFLVFICFMLRHYNPIFLSQNQKGKLILLVCFYFSLGFLTPFTFGFSIPTALFLCYLALYFNPRNLMLLVKARPLTYLYLLTTLYFTSVYLIGHSEMSNSRPMIIMLISLYYTTAFLLTALNEDWRYTKLLIFSFIFGIFSYSALVVGYNAWLDLEVYGYKNLYNPITKSTDNSPMYSNFLALGFSTALISFLFFSNLFLKAISSLVIFLSILSVLTIMGRTFLIISILSIVTIFFVYRKNNSLPSLALVLGISIISTYLIYSFILPEEAVSRFDKMFVKRLANLFDLQNPRYRLWYDGSIKLIENPSGGFFLKSGITQSESFHNLWIDTVKYSGWFPLGVLLIINSTFPFLYWKVKSNPQLFSIWFIGLVSLLLLSQEVILSSIIIFILYLYLMLSYFLVAKIIKHE
jgi:hypothetical protein